MRYSIVWAKQSAGQGLNYKAFLNAMYTYGVKSPQDSAIHLTGLGEKELLCADASAMRASETTRLVDNRRPRMQRDIHSLCEQCMAVHGIPADAERSAVRPDLRLHIGRDH